jgi:gliding motility-associated-like protein
MLLRKTIFLIACNLLVISAFSQRSANWFFGFNAGIKFTPSGIINQPASAILTDEGCSSLSDTAGNLLFYTDGISVWNKNHLVMVNGSGLLGNSSSSQSSIVVPMPGSDSLYYIFTATLPLSNAYYTYSIIDMKKQGGLGEVIQKNVLIGSLKCSERITAMQHANKIDFWIITNPINTDSFKVYLLTSAGLATTPVVSKIGRVSVSNFGMLKGSPDGKMVVHTVGNFAGFDITQLFRFDNATGILSNLVNIPFSKPYGCAFSPDSRRLYLNNSFPMTGGTPVAGSMAQFTVSIYDSTAIANSKYLFPAASIGGWGDLSVGPDSVMYIARHSVKKLSALKKPNDSAAACQFIDTAIVLTGTSHYGLPNFYNNINTPPQINLNIVRLSCLQYQFSFNTNYHGAGTYTWNFGDAYTSSDSSPVHTFIRTAADSFLVSFHFISADGTVNINVQNWLKLPPKPIAGFAAQSNGCIDQALTLANSSSSANGGIVYSWNFGDNTFSSLQLPTKFYIDTGHYTVQLSVTDALGCLSDTASTTVIVNKKVVAKFGIAGPFCTNSGLTIADTSAAWNTTITQWRYDFGGEVITSSSALNSYNYNTQGAYPVKLVLNTAAGCVSDTVIRNITVFEKPKAGFIMPRSCVTDLSAFTDTSSVGLPSLINKWRWYFDDPAVTNDTSLIKNPTYQYAAAANYNLRLIVSTDKGCADTLTKVFTVNGAQPKASLSFIQDPACGIDSVQLVNTSTVNFGTLIGLQVIWSNAITTDLTPSAGEIYRNNYPLFGNPSIKTEAVRLIVQSGVSCISSLDTFIIIKAQPKVQMLPIAAICSNEDPVILNHGSEIMGAAGTGSYLGTGVGLDVASGKYLFNPNLVSGSAQRITYRFTTAGGCFDTASQVINLLPKPVVNAGTPQTILYGNQTILNATASGTGLSYNWSPAMWVTNATLLTPFVFPARDTVFKLVVTTSDGCIDSSSVYIRVLQPITPPNAFSPNGDGINDKWNIPNIKTYSRPVLQVFNRWGQMLFQSIGYQTSWDGTSNGKPLPAGTYYYIIVAGEGSKPVSGWLQLLR